MTQAPLPPKVIKDVEELVVVEVVKDKVAGDELIESEVVVSEVPIAIIVKDSDGDRVEAVEVEDVDAVDDAVDDPDVDPLFNPDPVVDSVVDPKVDAVDWDKVEKYVENTLSVTVVEISDKVKSSPIVVVGTISSK